jgi:hypothetical protein
VKIPWHREIETMLVYTRNSICIYSNFNRYIVYYLFNLATKFQQLILSALLTRCRENGPYVDGVDGAIYRPFTFRETSVEDLQLDTQEDQSGTAFYLPILSLLKSTDQKTDQNNMLSLSFNF